AHVNWSSPLAVEVKGRLEVVTLGSETLQGYDAATGRLLWTANGPGDQCVPSPVLAGELGLVATDAGRLAIRPGEEQAPRFGRGRSSPSAAPGKTNARGVMSLHHCRIRGASTSRGTKESSAASTPPRASNYGRKGWAEISTPLPWPGMATSTWLPRRVLSTS